VEDFFAPTPRRPPAVTAKDIFSADTDDDLPPISKSVRQHFDFSAEASSDFIECVVKSDVGGVLDILNDLESMQGEAGPSKFLNTVVWEDPNAVDENAWYHPLSLAVLYKSLAS
jgi:hypothetical protein